MQSNNEKGEIIIILMASSKLGREVRERAKKYKTACFLNGLCDDALAGLAELPLVQGKLLCNRWSNEPKNLSSCPIHYQV